MTELGVPQPICRSNCRCPTGATEGASDEPLPTGETTISPQPLVSGTWVAARSQLRPSGATDLAPPHVPDGAGIGMLATKPMTIRMTPTTIMVLPCCGSRGRAGELESGGVRVDGGALDDGVDDLAGDVTPLGFLRFFMLADLDPRGLPRRPVT